MKQSILFGKKMKQKVKEKKLVKGSSKEGLERCAMYHKELRFLAYKLCAKAVHGNNPECAPLPECIELRVKYWMSRADDIPKFTGFLTEKIQVI